MANRFFENRAYSLEKATVDLNFIITATGANGNQTLTRNKGLALVTGCVQTATGIWTFNLGNTYNLLLWFDINWANATAPAAPSGWLTGVACNLVAAPTVVWQNATIAGVATSPAAGNIGYVEMVFSNSTAY